jgi:hypothetical protein
MAGTSPVPNPSATTIPTVLIPLKVVNGSQTFDPMRETPEQTIVPGIHGIARFSGCSLLGVVSNNRLDNHIRSVLLPSLTSAGVIAPTQFALFLLRNVVQSTVDPPTLIRCCVFGYHSAVGTPAHNQFTPSIGAAETLKERDVLGTRETLSPGRHLLNS